MIFTERFMVEALMCHKKCCFVFWTLFHSRKSKKKIVFNYLTNGWTIIHQFSENLEHSSQFRRHGLSFQVPGFQLSLDEEKRKWKYVSWLVIGLKTIIYSLYTFNIWEAVKKNSLHNVWTSRSLSLPASWTKAPTHRICAPREAERMRWQRYKHCHGEDDHLGTTTVALWLHKGWHLYCFSLLHWKTITWPICINICMFPWNRSLGVFYFIYIILFQQMHSFVRKV